MKTWPLVFTTDMIGESGIKGQGPLSRFFFRSCTYQRKENRKIVRENFSGLQTNRIIKERDGGLEIGAATAIDR